MQAHDFLLALTIVLCVAAITTVIFQRLRQPVVLGYMLAGLLVGPHVPIPLVADPAIVQTLSELGVILLMFSLGLEFSLRKLISVGPSAGITAIVQCSVMLWLGFAIGQLLGWTVMESIFMGAIISISSTTIIAKAFDEQKVKGRLRELVVGVLVVEDIIAILLMAILTAVASGGDLEAKTLIVSTAKLLGFLIALVVVGLLVIPRAMRFVIRLKRDETTLVATIGICFGIALLALEMGYSVALGAFIAGVLVSESGQTEKIEHLIAPVRDMFAAVFFVSVGMLIDPALVQMHWVAVFIFTVVVIAGKILSVFIGAFLTGNGTRASVQTGMSLAQIGEFSFIIAALGIALNATGHFLYPIAVAVSAITTLSTPWLIRASGPFANLVDRKLPAPIQTFATLYGSWVEGLKQQEVQKSVRTKQLVRWMLIDLAFLIGIIIIAARLMNVLPGWIATQLGLPASPYIALSAAALVASPFLIGIFRVGRSLGVSLSTQVFPESESGKLDLAAAPRRVFQVALQLVLLLLVGLPIVALTQPFLPGVPAIAIMILLLVIFGVVFWRSAANFQGHVQAGSEMLLEVLAKQAQNVDGHRPAEMEFLPGLGAPTRIVLSANDIAVGKTLASLNLRGVTGASVLAIHRDGQGLVEDIAHEELQSGDILAIVGTNESLAQARKLLCKTGVTGPSRPR
ncbi:MAG: cation:proton antiporter [Spirochaetia bacterium]|nr:cation:proton antiporter [Spirochaetia bacterium]